MPNLSSWKTPRDSSSVARILYYFFPCGQRKSTHFTIFLPSDRSSSTSSWSSFTKLNPRGPYSTSQRKIKISSRQKDAKTEEVGTSKAQTVKRTDARSRMRPFSKKLLFGSKKFRSIVLLNVITVVTASDIAVIKDVEAFTNPAYFSAIRFAVCTLPFLPFILQARHDVKTRNSGLELGLWVSLGYLIEAVGLVTSDAGRASFISLCTVIVIPLFESMLGAIVPARTWFGIVMSVLGIAMLECGGSPPSIGDLFNFVSAIFFGIHTLRTKHISRTTRKENFLPLLGYEVAVVAVLSTLWCLIGAHIDGIQDNNRVSWTWALFWDWITAFPWVPALYTGVFSTGLCLWGEIAAISDVSATETAVIYGMEPLWGAGFAWFLLGERWGMAGWIGAALILGGSLTVQIIEASANESIDGSQSQKDSDPSIVSDRNKLKQSISASPIIVSSRENIIHRLK